MEIQALIANQNIQSMNRHNEIKAQNERIINGQMITQQILRDMLEEQKKTNDLLSRILATN